MQFDPENHISSRNASSNPFLAGFMFVLEGNGLVGEIIRGFYYLANYQVIYGNMPLHWLGSCMIVTWILTDVSTWVQSLISFGAIKEDGLIEVDNIEQLLS